MGTRDKSPSDKSSGKRARNERIQFVKSRVGLASAHCAAHSPPARLAKTIPIVRVVPNQFRGYSIELMIAAGILKVSN